MRRAITVSGLITLISASAALAAADRPKPQVLESSAKGLTNAQVAIDGSGRATVVWEHGGSAYRSHRVHSVRLSAKGKPRGRVREISPAGGLSPQLAIGPGGTSTVVWTRFGDADTVQTLQLDPSGAPTGPVRTLSDPRRDASHPGVAVDPSGNATIVWAKGGGVHYARIGPDGTPQGGAKVLSARRPAGHPIPAAAPDGRVTVAWMSGGGIYTARIAADGEIERPAKEFPGAKQARQPQLAVDGVGRVTLAWAARFAGEVNLARVRADGGKGEHRVISTPGLSALPQLAANGSGRLAVAWEQKNPSSGWKVFGAVLGPGLAGGRATALSGRKSQQPQVGIDSKGAATVVWRGHDGISTRIQAVRIGPSGAPGRVRTLSAAGRPKWANAVSPDVAVNARGAGAIVWERFDVASRRDRIESTTISRR